MPYFRHRVTGPNPGGDVWVSTMHSNSANTLASVHTAWTTFINNFFSTTYNALMPNEQSATGTVTDQLDPVTGRNVAQVSSTITQVGTGTGGTPSPRNCLVVQLLTTLPTRSGRGRMFLPSPDVSHYTANGQFDSAMVSTVSSAFAAGLTTFKATSQPVVFHRDTKTGTNLSGIKIGVIVGTQRRRTNKDLNTYSSNNV